MNCDQLSKYLFAMQDLIQQMQKLIHTPEPEPREPRSWPGDPYYDVHHDDD
jgi:hypothetical protein